jgi:hypothetical protein
MWGWRIVRALVLALAVAANAAGCGEVNQAITGRDLACPDSDTSSCIAMADTAVRALDPALASSVTRIELAEMPCDAEPWWEGQAMPPGVDRCWEVMASTADGWRRGTVVRFDDGRLHVAW